MQNIEKKKRKIEYQTLCSGYSLESSLGDDSNEYPQHGVWKRTFEFRMSSNPPPPPPSYLDLCRMMEFSHRYARNCFGKRRKCYLSAGFPFPTMFLKAIIFKIEKQRMKW